MQYTPKHIDIEAFEKALNDARATEERNLFIKQERAQSYYRGYEDCVSQVISMLHCANYEKREKTEQEES